MTWFRDTLTTIRDRTKSDFIAESETGDAVLRRSPENAIVYALSGAAHGLYGAIGWTIKQAVPSEDSDFDSILRWADDFLTVSRKPAGEASGDIQLDGVIGSVVAAGERVSREGATYEVTTGGTISHPSGAIWLPVIAIESGANGNAATDTVVTLESPITGVNSEGKVSAGGLSGGSDAEQKLGVLGRLRNRLRNPPLAGSRGNYVTWATAVPGITRATEFKNEPDVGWVTLVVMDDDGVTAPIPGAAAVSDAQDAVDDARPTAMGGANVMAPNESPLLLEWSNLEPDDATTRANIIENVDAWIKSREPEEIVLQPQIEDAGQRADLVNNVQLTSPVIDQDPGQYAIFTTVIHNFV